jgi:hypothetical protein
VVSDFRLFNRRFVSTKLVEVTDDLETALAYLLLDLIDFNDLIFGTLEDFPLILFAFLIFTDLLIVFKLFTDPELPVEITVEMDSNAIAMRVKIDLYLVHMMIKQFFTKYINKMFNVLSKFKL